MIDKLNQELFAKYKETQLSKDIENAKVKITKVFRNEFENPRADNYTSQFLTMGGSKLIYEKYDPTNIYNTIEKDTIPIIELLMLCEKSESIVIKSTDIISKGKTEFHKRNIKLLREILIEGIKAKNIPTFNENWSKLIEKCKYWNNEKINAEDAKHIENYYLYTLKQLTDFLHFESITNRYIFIYKLAIAYDIYKNDNLYDFTNGYDRKQVTDNLKYKIKAYQKWRKDNSITEGKDILE